MESRLRKRGRPPIKDVEKHIFISDFQIPNQDDLTLSAVLKFITDFKPDVIHFVGDILDLTTLSSFTPDVYDRHTLMDEITMGRTILKQFADMGKKANKDVVLRFYSGNHEERSLKYLAKKAPELADLTNEDGEHIISIPHLLNLKKLQIKWVPYMQEHFEKGRVGVEHGDIARMHAGYTAKGMLERRGHNGFSGHTHRLALHMVTHAGNPKFWVETGMLCKQTWKHAYTRSPNWQQGFAVGHYLSDTGMMHPTVIPIFNHTFVWGDKVYKP